MITILRRLTVTQKIQYSVSACINYASYISRGCNRLRSFATTRGLQSHHRQFSEGEQKIHDLLRAKFPAAEQIYVLDMSGGCGTMYDIAITSEEFRGKRTVLQHRLVNEALGEEAKQIHGFRVKTQLPSSDDEKS